MAHQEEWIRLYDVLSKDVEPNIKLVEKCMGSRNGIGETMLHWYSLEGDPKVLEKLILLGFDINTQNDFGNTPVMEASFIGRWDNVLVLINHGARLDIINENNENYFEYLEVYEKEIPEWIGKSVQKQDE